MALSDIQTLVDAFVRDASATVSTLDRDSAIALAVQKLSEDAPITKVEDVVADGSNFLSLPASWDADFSTINHIEYPIGSTPPVLIEQDQWAFYESPTDKKVQIIYAINSGENVRFNYNIPHTLDAVTDTTKPKHKEPLAAYAASLLLFELASHYTNDGDPTIAADAVDHQNKGRDYAARAKDLRKLYFQRLGIKEDKTGPACTIVDLDSSDSRGRDRITHPRKFR